MSLTSNDQTDNASQSEIDCLLLDLGLFPASEKISKALSERQADPVQAINSKTITIDLTTEPMGDADWDAALDNILKAKRCITL